jgi:hypothetical protein
MDFMTMVYFLPEIQGGLPGNLFMDKDKFRGFASFDEGETFWSVQLEFIVSPDQFGFGVADVSLHNPEGFDLDVGKTFTIHEGKKPIAYCRIV